MKRYILLYASNPITYCLIDTVEKVSTTYYFNFLRAIEEMGKNNTTDSYTTSSSGDVFEVLNGTYPKEHIIFEEDTLPTPDTHPEYFI